MSKRTPFSPMKEFKDDADWLSTFDQIDSPLEALRLILDNESYLGYDPYYKDIREAVLDVADRVLKKHAGVDYARK